MEMILSNLDKKNLIQSPTPHYELDQIVDSDTYRTFIDEFPKLDEFKKKGEVETSNIDLSFPFEDIIQGDTFGPAVKEFFRLHTSKEFYTKIVEDLFHDEIAGMYPGVLRGDFNIKLGGSLTINTPVLNEPSSVLGPHLDNPRLLYLLLFYIRLPLDDSEGGELELYRYKTRFKGYDPVRRRRLIPEKDLESVKTIQRKGNNGILLLNSINAIHGVTPRNPTPHMRCYFRFNAQTDKPLFEEKDYLTWTDRIKYKVRTTVRI